MSKKRKDYEESSGNVFADLDLDQPEELLTRAKLLHKIGLLIKASKLSQEVIAKKLGISQSKVSMLVSGKLSQFTADTLMYYLSIIGCEVQIRIKEPRSRVGMFRHRGYIAVC